MQAFRGVADNKADRQPLKPHVQNCIHQVAEIIPRHLSFHFADNKMNVAGWCMPAEVPPETSTSAKHCYLCRMPCRAGAVIYLKKPILPLTYVAFSNESSEQA